MEAEISIGKPASQTVIREEMITILQLGSEMTLQESELSQSNIPTLENNNDGCI